MKRIFYNLGWFLFGVTIAAVPILAFASVQPVPIPGVSAVGGELFHTSRLGVQTLVYPSLQTTSPLSIPVAGMVPPGRQLMVIPTTITPNAARVGAAVAKLSRLTTPVGLGLTLMPILCAETGICKNQDLDQYEVEGNTAPASATTLWKPQFGGPYNFTTVSNVCGYDLSLWPSGYECADINETTGSYKIRTIAPPNTAVSRQAVVERTCPSGYTLTQDGLCLSDSPVSHPPTETDWQQAATKLGTALNRMADMISGLQEKNQPVPIDKPVLSPTSETLPSTSTVNRDATGNLTSTTTTTTTINQNPITNNTTTNTTNITITTITNITGPNGEPISTTETGSEPPPPEDTEIEFDTVPDEELEKQELPLTLTPSTWGEGTCPGDPSVTVLGQSVTIPVHVVCDYMTAVRNVVIAACALIAAYIVVGVRFE